MDALKAFLPAPSFSKIKQWIDELDVQVKITNPRKTKLGDFKVTGNRMSISINNNLNKYSFLIGKIIRAQRNSRKRLKNIGL